MKTRNESKEAKMASDETTAVICAKMREVLNKFVRAYGYEKCVHTTLLAEAYEDAKAILTVPPEPIGNGAKQREALKQIRDYARSHGVWDIEVMATIALAEPPRNCDIGTAEEQDKRFTKFCNKGNGGVCLGCPVIGLADCTFEWSQMPYEEGGTDGDEK